MRLNPVVGGWYAFCQTCGGWRGFHTVFADNDGPVEYCLPEGGSVMTTNRASIDKFKAEHEGPGVSIEYFDVGNDPGPCDCIRPEEPPPSPPGGRP